MWFMQTQGHKVKTVSFSCLLKACLFPHGPCAHGRSPCALVLMQTDRSILPDTNHRTRLKGKPHYCYIHLASEELFSIISYKKGVIKALDDSFRTSTAFKSGRFNITVRDTAFKTRLLHRPRLCLGAKHRGGVIL